MRTCPSCGASNADGARFCSQCAAELAVIEARFCPACGSEVGFHDRFCPQCGASLGHEEEERKLVTILFADITGSTSLGEKLDPETLKEVMGSYFRAMSKEIEAEGGTVEKFIGDAIMAAFGVPSAHEDDPARGLRAAVRMRNRLEMLNRDLERRYAVTLAMRIGVNTGEVMASTTPGQTMGMVSGDAVNVAARLEQSAEPGQIVASERTARATRGFEFGRPSRIEIRGRDEKTTAVTLLATTTVEPVQERGIPGLNAPMIGRDRELDLMQSLFRRVSEEQRPHLVTIYGDPGIGKSRLIKEFTAWATEDDKGAGVLFGRCLPYGEGVTYWPLAEILKARAGVLDSDPPDVAMGKIRSLVGGTLGTADPARQAAALAFAIGLEDPRIPFADLSPRQVRLEVHDAWRSLFSGLASSAPVVVVVEDIHWADGALLDLLEELAERTPGPVLFVCPARNELTQRRATWGGGKRNFSSIALEPLSPADARHLIEFLLAIDDLPGETQQLILSRAEGNPFFLEEIIRHLIDEGRILRAGDRWRAASAIGDAVIPDTVQGVLAARIDLLEPREKRTLQSAAVVGRVFWAGPVARLLNGDADALDQALDALESRDLIISRLGSAVAGDREFIFKHILTRDVAYGSLPRRERGTAHGRVAAWIEEAAGERYREFADLLAYHYSEAYERALAEGSPSLEQLRRKTFDFLLIAAAEARSKMLLARARATGSRALDLSTTIEERAAAHESLGVTAMYEYAGDDAWRWLTQAVDEQVGSGSFDPQTLAMLCARAVDVPTRWPGSMTDLPDEDEVRRYLQLGFSNAGNAATEARFRLLLAESFWPFAFRLYSDEADARGRAAGEEALSLARELARPDLESAAYDGLGSIEFVRGYHGRLADITAVRIEVAKKLIDPWEIGDAYQIAAGIALFVGSYARALELASEGYERSREGPAWGACLAWGAIARGKLGDWDGLLDDVRELGLGPDPDSFWYYELIGNAALVLERRGESSAAVDMLDRIGMDTWKRGLARAAAPASLVYSMQGEGERAWSLLEHPWDSRVVMGSLLEARCDVVALTLAWDRAPDTIARARGWAEEASLVALPFYADRLEGRAAVVEGEIRAGVASLERSREGFASIGARWEEAATALSLGEALTAEGERGLARRRLEAALAVFEELRPVRELTRARSLLSRL